MLKRIIEAALDGQSCREIASWTRPAVSHATIGRYLKDVLQPTMARGKHLELLRSANNDANTGLAPLSHDETQLRQDVTDALMGAPVLSVRENRLKAQEDRHRRMQMIVEERGAEMSGEVAGGASGLLVRDYKGKDADRAIYKFDASLVGEMREHEKQIAQELGQWQEAPATQVAIQIVVPGRADSFEQHEKYPTIDIALPKR